jgi:LPXTG-site transpeptidase (sortase) family protein
MSKTALIRSVGVALILAGILIAGRVVYTVNHQAAHDADQDKAWQQFMGAAQGQAPAASPAPTDSPVAPAELPSGLYLKMTLPKLGRDAVAVNGDWDSLKTSSTVHYKTSPAPGQKGNMLIAFHREPKWLDINVQAGDLVRIDALDHHAYMYKVEFVKIVSATDVSNLKATTGTDLTLITCDPPWQDYNRMVVRAHLVPSA